VAKKPARKLNVYTNLSHRRRTKKDAATRKKAEYLATLPKHPLKRTLYRMHPKRFWGYWFSKKGLIMSLKITGVFILFMVLAVGALFAYYRKDLDMIRPGELAKSVQTTVTKYYDRNGVLLWEDKGSKDYRLVVENDQINKYMKDATVAIEDRDFYNHHGISVTGLLRAFVNNAGGGSTQGGSTLTQQLVKQVFFADEAQKRGLDGVPRKIKEVILSIEVERMYNKEQILDLYLNESPYGGRRNGVESAAQTYFGKKAKDLSLAEAALLASIPQNPGTYNPYNTAGNASLVARQHAVLDNMADQGFIKKSEADAAKKVAILDSIKPEADQYKDIKAPHFVQMVRSELETELGKATVGKGGLTVKTTLDYRIQQKLEEAMNDMFNSSIPNYAGFTNGAGTVEDVQTGQIVAMLGSRDFNYPGYGQDNAAVSFIQPGSSIKPLVYAKLFENKGANVQNYGSGTVLKDEPIDAIYGAKLQNADKTFKGNLTIRQSLAQSRNVPAVKAMYISGVQPTLEYIRAAGDKEYCTQGDEKQAGLSSAIGGCGSKQVDHVNAFATLARGGVYKPHSSVLEVKNTQGETLKKWTDEVSKQVIDPQAAFIVSDILGDANARKPLFGSITTGFIVPGAKTATKTGTTDLGGQAKDLWMMSYSPVLSMGVWLGNSDTRTLKNGNSTLPGPIISKVMQYAHELYVQDKKYTPGGWFTKPAGVQTIGGELFPSWYSKGQGQSSAKMTFDKVSKKKATDCTPDAAKIEIDVTKMIDPVSKKDVFIAPDGYDSTKDDDTHKCDDVKPIVSITSVTNHKVKLTIAQGTFGLQTLTVTVNGQVVNTQAIAAGGPVEILTESHNGDVVVATVDDAALYTGSDTKTN
jgi:membrane peptidoglycan carboxypeptidase